MKKILFLSKLFLFLFLIGVFISTAAIAFGFQEKIADASQRGVFL